MALVLSPFTKEHLTTVQPWFRHPEVTRWLGGPDWPARGLELQNSGIGETFRGRRVMRTHSWVGFDTSGAAVALIGGDVYDRWSRYTETPDGPVVDAIEPGPAMGMAYVVNPQRWRQGFGTAALLAAMNAPEVADVVVFAAGIEPDNIPSARCALRAGMTPDTAVPDWEGMIYHLRRRISLRPAVAEDVPELRAIAIAAYERYVPRIGRPPAPMTADYAQAVRAGQVWVAAADGVLVGLVVLVRQDDHLLLENIAVSPSAQGRGIGGRLLAFAEVHARQHGLSQVRLYTNEAMTENLAYYPRRGYVETHRTEQNGFRRVFFRKLVQPKPVT
jgi:GNAT superfamily N-acetyltransferase